MAASLITTAGNVTMAQPVAPITRRVWARIIDMMAMWFYSIFARMIFSGINRPYGDEGLSMIIALLLACPVLFYSLWTETLWHGQTLGKMVLGLRVIRQDGSAATFTDYALRWLLLSVDLNVTGGLGLLVMCCNQRNQRLGDLAAGTIVVNSNEIDLMYSRPVVPYANPEYRPTYPEAADMDINQSEVIERTLKLDANDSQGLASRLSVIVQHTLGIMPRVQHTTPSEFLSVVLNDYLYYSSRPLIDDDSHA